MLPLILGAALAVGPFHLQDTAGAWHGAGEWRGAKAVVLFFLSMDCPISNGYAPEIQRIHTAYAGRGVRFYAVQPDPDRAREEAKKYAADFGYTFPMLLDAQQSLTRATEVTILPQVVVLSSQGEVLYSGRVDDRYIAIGKPRYKPTRHDLRDALDAVLGGKPVPHAKTEAVGCVVPGSPRLLR